jgi:N6-adenosine-specific RNA methylase IME4
MDQPPAAQLRAEGKDATPRAVATLLTQGNKKERRAQRERALGEKQLALPDKRYGVIVADPEWQFEPWSRETGMDRAADNHYPTSVTRVIAARDVPSIAADDCVLFLWATIPMLPHALLVMAAWDFDYVSHYAWGKDKIGTGYWSREKHELLLIGTRGKIVAPAQGMQSDSLIMAPRGEHSEKPECFLEMIEGYFPTLPKIELNRRGPPRPGWDAWGNETETVEAAE